MAQQGQEDGAPDIATGDASSPKSSTYVRKEPRLTKNGKRVGRPPDLAPLPPERQCTARRRDLGRCTNARVLGLTVCRMHGGGSPYVRAAGARRLMDFQPKAIETAGELLNPVVEGQTCPLCKRGQLRDEMVRLRASQLVLDRTGHGPTQKVEIKPADIAFLEYLTDEQVAQIDVWIEEAKLKAAEDLGLQAEIEPANA